LVRGTPKSIIWQIKPRFETFGVFMVNKTLFWSFFADFCAFCASLRLIKHLFSQLLYKAISMALWTKATLCVKSSLLEQSLPRLVRHPFGGTQSRSIRSLPTYQVGPCNPRNPWLINDLRVCKLLYNCKEDSTTIESSLQIKLFMQNKANFQKVK
jgi:hypothetical protein